MSWLCHVIFLSLIWESGPFRSGPLATKGRERSKSSVPSAIRLINVVPLLSNTDIHMKNITRAGHSDTGSAQFTDSNVEGGTLNVLIRHR